MYNIPTNTTGYTRGTETEKNFSNLIPSNKITMANVDKPLVLIPIKGGVPQYHLKRIAKPGDPDIDFGDEIDSVLELPYAQAQYPIIGDGKGGNNFNINWNQNPISNGGMGTNVNLGGSSWYGNMSNLQTMFPDPKKAKEDMASAINYSTGQVGASRNENESINTIRENVLNTTNVDPTVVGEPIKIDPNLSQKLSANVTQKKIQQQKGQPFVGAINPYGSWNLSNTATMLGAFIQDKNPLGIAASAGKFILAGARNAFSGAAAMKRFREGQQDQSDYDTESRRTEGQVDYRKEGGQIPQEKKQGLLMTGNFLEGDENPDNQKVAEVEKGEYLQTPDGHTMEMLGKRHSEGGELINVPGGTKVISDYLKIGSKLATYFKKEWGLNVSSGSTYATVLDKYKQKLGLTELLEEEAKILKKMVDQEDTKFEGTRDINLQILSKQQQELQGKKSELEDYFNDFTNLVFDKQEQNKPDKGENPDKMQDGGEVSPEEQLSRAIQLYAQQQGVDPQQIVNQLQQLPKDQQEQMLQEIMASAQQTQQQEGGGQDQIMQLIQAYAGATQQDPQQVVSQIQQLPEEQVKEFIQQMLQTVQQAQGQPQQAEQPQMRRGGGLGSRGGNVQKNEFIRSKLREYISNGLSRDEALQKAFKTYENGGEEVKEEEVMQEGGEMAPQQPQGNEQEQAMQMIAQALQQGQTPEQVVQALVAEGVAQEQAQQIVQQVIQMLQQQQQQGVEPQQPQMQKGGKIEKSKWISEKVKELIKEGRPQKQALAIAYSLYNNQFKQDGGEVKKYQFGEKTPPPTDSLISTWEKFLKSDYKYGIAAETQYVSDAFEEPNYKLEDIKDIAKRFKTLADQRDIDYSKLDLNIRDGVDALAGMTQQYDKKNTPGLVQDYGMNIGLTKQGVDHFLKNSKLTKEVSPELLAKLKKAVRGTYESSEFTKQDREEVMAAVNKVGDTSFADKNYLDNKGYFRGIDKQTIYFKDKVEFEQYKKDKGTAIDGYYKTDKKGIYVRPLLLQPREFPTQEAKDKWVEENKAKADTQHKDFFSEKQNDIFEVPFVAGQVKPIITPTTEEPKVDAEGNPIQPWNVPKTNYSAQLPIQVPDQSNLPPIYLPTSMRQVKNVQANSIALSPEENFKELSRNNQTAQSLLVNLNPQTAGAGLANLQAQQNASINDAIYKTQVANQADQRNVDNINETRINERDRINLGLAAKYEKESVIGLDNFYNEWRNFHTNRNQQNLANFEYQNKINYSNAINPNFQVGARGEIYQTDEPIILYSTNGVPIGIQDPKTKVVTKTESINSSGNKQTQTTTQGGQKKKKGGLILTQSLLNLLKK